MAEKLVPLEASIHLNFSAESAKISWVAVKGQQLLGNWFWNDAEMFSELTSLTSQSEFLAGKCIVNKQKGHCFKKL